VTRPLISPWLSLAILVGGLILLTSHSFAEAATATGPLRVLSSNKRYFTDGSGKAIYLTGSHTWNNLQDRGSSDPPPAFNYSGYLNLLASNNLNFMRMWRWEMTRSQVDTQTYYSAPHPWPRTGPGTAKDGKPKFDLSRFNQAYFDRLRSRVIAARDRGIYVSIMLFEGWAIQFSDSSWRKDGHPLAASNNINGINGDPNGDGYLKEAHTLQIPAIVNIQKAYVRKVIDTVNDLNNVLYEISNEDHSGSYEWQKEMTNYIKSYEANNKPKQHPVGITAIVKVANSTLLSSPAHWVSLNSAQFNSTSEPYASNPPAAGTSKVSILDSDHIGWGIYINNATFSRAWVWKSFLRGHNPILMEDLTSSAGWVAARKSMGHTRTYATKMNLAAMTPQNGLASTSYCLANAGSEYLVYQPGSGGFNVNLAAGTYSVEWFNPQTGAASSGGSVTVSAGLRSFSPPFSGTVVLYLKRGAPGVF
jgi:hypothetical protein